MIYILIEMNQLFKVGCYKKVGMKIYKPKQKNIIKLMTYINNKLKTIKNGK
jgi:hypothetical protein